MKIEEILFLFIGNGTAMIAGKAENIGAIGAAGVGISAAREKKGSAVKKTVGVKISTIANAVNDIFNRGIEMAYVNEHDQIVFQKNNILFLYDGKALKFSEAPTPAYPLAQIALFLEDLRTNEEQRKNFFQAIEDMNNFGTVSKKTMYRLMDEYFYNNEAFMDVDIALEEEPSLRQMHERSANANARKPVFPSALYFPTGEVVKPTSSSDSADIFQLSDEELRNKIENGEFKVNYEFKDKDSIPTGVLPTYVITDDFRFILNKCKYRTDGVIENLDMGLEGLDAIGNNYLNILLAGSPGTGKTTLARALGDALHMPTYFEPLSQNTEEDVSEGKNRIVDGKLAFVEGDFLKAYTNGGVIVLEEGNLPPASVMMGAFGQAIEKPFTLKRNGYDTLHRHPLCIVIMTMNADTTGSNQLNEALDSRFKVTCVIDDPKREDLIDVLTKNGFKKKETTWVYDAYDSILFFLKDEDTISEVCEPRILAQSITLRQCIAALENIEEGCEPYKACEYAFINKIKKIDRDLAERAMSILENQPVPDFD